MFLPITRAARMERQNREESELAARVLLMWFMARMTVARFGIPCEKKSVVSLKSLRKVFSNTRGKSTKIYLQNTTKLLSDLPFFRGQLIFLEVKVAQSSHCIDCWPKLKGEVEHVVS
jgi:hypothetical protein